MVSTGLLGQADSSDLHAAWQAAFHSAVSAVYMSLQPAVHETLLRALLEAIHMLPETKHKSQTDAASATTQAGVSVLAQSQSQSGTDQPDPAEAAGMQEQQAVPLSSTQLPVRVVKAAWPELPKLNSISAEPMQDTSPATWPTAGLPLSAVASLPRVSGGWQGPLQLPVALDLCSR